jgi:hypothetical protein
MARDSLFGERIIWTGRPKVARVPFANKVVAAFAAGVSVIAVCFAIVVATALHARVGGMLVFAAWCATIALGSWRLPIVWRSQVEFIVTDKHVIWRRGRIRRSIERSAISYALVRWAPGVPGVGDLVVVRAVPTGALRRTLRLTLVDVEAPDRLWAIVRDVEAGPSLGDGERPLGQRLDAGERVLWTAMPMASSWSPRRAATAVLGLVAGAASVWVLLRAIPWLRSVNGVHELSVATMVTLVAAVALQAAILIAIALYVGYAAWIRPVRRCHATRYWVTDRRVLIRRGSEELLLERARIAYVIDGPVWSGGLHDVFLVLDGPQARALATSGAFARFRVGDDESLTPVLSAIDDAETVSAILRGDPRLEPLGNAA